VRIEAYVDGGKGVFRKGNFDLFAASGELAIVLLGLGAIFLNECR
jgi:hypothetical protein